MDGWLVRTAAKAASVSERRLYQVAGALREGGQSRDGKHRGHGIIVSGHRDTDCDVVLEC